MKNLEYFILSLALASCSSFVAAEQNDSIYQNETYLGYSSNPNPSNYGKIPATPYNMVQPNSINANWRLNSQLTNDNNIINRVDKDFVQPAWANRIEHNSIYTNQKFGANLFQGHFANTYSDNLNPSYQITPGDRIVIRIWGAKKYDDVLVVDQQGNIFIPEIGPVHVNGITQSNLFSTIKKHIASIFTDNVEVYVNLQSSQPIGIFVTGFVPNPGQYAGGAYDSILSFLDRAGGIDPNRGSFRNIEIKRNNKVIQKVDLYDFILNGNKPNLKLQDGDVILVQNKLCEVRIIGNVKEEAFYELKDKQDGATVIKMIQPYSNVTHVSISGTRNNSPQHFYLTLNDFKKFKLEDGDLIDFVADKKGNTIIAKVSGAITGPSRYPINKNITLRKLLSHVEIDSNLADISAIYIKRKSVAYQQQITINDALRRLEQSALTATSSSVDEAQIRVQEAKLIQDFVKRAGLIEPDGIVVVSRRGIVKDIRLEDEDEIVIPQVSDVIQISGEVMIPKAVTFDPNMSLDDYLAAAGGFSNRADDKNILIAKANGEVGLAKDLGINKGDRILVIPRFDSKNMQLAKDLMQIIYQMAVATKVVVDL